MYKCKIFISITIFTIFLVGTSMIKNQTRNLEKKIYNLSKIIYFHEENLKESQLDFFLPFITNNIRAKGRVC